MEYFLFLDDARNPPKNDKKWIVARTFTEALTIVKTYGMPIFISFDHDLGLPEDGKNGYDFVTWLEKEIRTSKKYFPEGFEYFVHSMNPVGKRNIENVMKKLKNDGFF